MIICRSASEIERMRPAGRLVGDILTELSRLVAPGVTSLDLDREASRLMRDAGARSAFKGYRGYPATICTAINEQVIHGIPSARKLIAGDIVSLDVGVELGGFFADSAITVPVGDILAEAATLLRVTEEALFLAIDQVRPGARVGDIGHAVEQHAIAHGFAVVREFVGHGIGQAMHEDLQVPNYGPPGRGPRLAEGMVMAIEPMLTAGDSGVDVLDDGWTAVTRDGSLAAHFEHTVAVTRDGPLILTSRVAAV
jgi:methionyl aminopeptidase